MSSPTIEKSILTHYSEQLSEKNDITQFNNG